MAHEIEPMTTPQRPLPSGYNAQTTAREVIDGRRLDGKIAIVTGGYAGVGLETTRALSAAGATLRTPAVLWTCDGSAGQRWMPLANGALVNAASGMCLDATGGSSANGTKLIVYTCNNGLNQRWALP